jgi:hypothetical protein
LHGADSTGPTTPEGKAKAVAAMVAGRAAWVEEMRAAKGAGLIDQFPGGRKKSKGKKKAVKRDKVTRQALVVIEQEKAMHDVSPPPQTAPAEWASQTHGDKLDVLVGSALDVIKGVLELPDDPGNLKLMSLKKDAALSVIGAQIKIGKSRVQKSETENLKKLLDCLRRGDPAPVLD